MTILLIEDDKQLAEYLAISLPEADVSIASSLTAAKKLLDTMTFGLMLIDLNLPDSRGLDTLKALRQYAGPKLVISGCCGHTVSQMTNVLDYIDKMNTPSEIVARIRFNIDKMSRRTERFAPEIFEEIKGHLISARMASV